MDILDKLFSRELKRRTGNHVIKITSEKRRRREIIQRALGSEALRASNKNHRPKNIKSSSLFQRINIRFPWLKIVAVLLIGFAAIFDLLDLTISKTGESSYHKIAIAPPMSKHVKVTERDLEGKKLIALTFDDGPYDQTTPRLLDILKEKDAVATFFVLGSRARINPDIIKREDSEGNEVASHTMYHQNLIRISGAAAEADISESKAVIRDILGHEAAFTRPPYGNINTPIANLIGTPLIFWSIDTLDWKNRDANAILENAKSQVFDGAIILMHDIYDTSVDAVGPIIDELRKAGYEFATISEMVEMRGINLINGMSYRDFSP